MMPPMKEVLFVSIQGDVMLLGFLLAMAALVPLVLNYSLRNHTIRNHLVGFAMGLVTAALGVMAYAQWWMS